MTACALVGQIGDISRFKSVDKLANYAGVAPVCFSSAGKGKYVQNKNQGNRELYSVLYLLAMQQVKKCRSGKNELKPWLKKEYCIPKATAEYVERMEDVLEVYKRPYDPIRPVVCLVETSRQLIGEITPEQPAMPGKAATYDYEYGAGGYPQLKVDEIIKFDEVKMMQNV